MSEKDHTSLIIGIGVGIGLGVVAVATAPAWLPAAKAKALQIGFIKGAKFMTTMALV